MTISKDTIRGLLTETPTGDLRWVPAKVGGYKLQQQLLIQTNKTSHLEWRTVPVVKP